MDGLMPRWLMVATKNRKCGYSKCGKKFTPRRGLQRTCQTPECALGYSRERAAKKRSRAARTLTRDQREALKSKPQLLAEAQKEFNRFIRLRDKGLPCISCGNYPKSDHLTGGNMDCGHYRSIGSAPELRFTEDNAHAQCKRCNNFRSGNAVDYRIGLVARIGALRVGIVETAHGLPNWTRDEIRFIRDTYRRKARELKSTAV